MLGECGADDIGNIGEGAACNRREAGHESCEQGQGGLRVRRERRGRARDAFAEGALFRGGRGAGRECDDGGAGQGLFHRCRLRGSGGFARSLKIRRIALDFDKLNSQYEGRRCMYAYY